MKQSDRAPLKKAQRVGSVLQELLGKPGIGEQITRHQAWLVWDQIVGEQIAARARPKKIRRGILEVQVDHPVWMQQLHMLKPKILEKINATIPNAGISDIYLRQTKAVNPPYLKPSQRTSEPLPWSKIELNDWEKRTIEQQLEVIEDTDLKEEFRRLLTLQKQVNKNRAD